MPPFEFGRGCRESHFRALLAPPPAAPPIKSPPIRASLSHTAAAGHPGHPAVPGTPGRRPDPLHGRPAEPRHAVRRRKSRPRLAGRRGDPRGQGQGIRERSSRCPHVLLSGGRCRRRRLCDRTGSSPASLARPPAAAALPAPRRAGPARREKQLCGLQGQAQPELLVPAPRWRSAPMLSPPRGRAALPAGTVRVRCGGASEGRVWPRGCRPRRSGVPWRGLAVGR